MRDKRYDIMKGISIITMIFCHLVKIRPIRIFVYAFHMPLFFINAGYFFKEKGIWGQIKGSFRSLVIPYTVTGIVHFIWLGLVCIVNETGFQFALFEKYFISFIFGLGWQRDNLSYTVGPIWFLVCLFWARIFFELILHFCKTEKGRVIVVIIVSVLGILIGQKVSLPYSIDVSMASMIFFLWGYYSDRIKKWLNENRIVKVLCVSASSLIGIVTIGYDYYSNTYLNLVGRSWPLFLFSGITAIWLYEVILLIVTKTTEFYSYSFIEKLGKYSLWALCIHYVCARFDVIKTFFSKSALLQVYLEQIVMFIITLVVIILILKCLENIKQKNRES